MNDEGVQMYMAKIKKWLILAHLHDLTELKRGDLNRFGRMVDGRGSGLGSAGKAADSIKSLLEDSDVKAFYPELENFVNERLNE